MNNELPHGRLTFMVDANAGRVARWLRMMGYDAVFFSSGEDAEMISRALKENRVLVTRNRHIIERRVATSGRLGVILLISDRPEQQMRQVITELSLDSHLEPFTRCLECNRLLEARPKDAVEQKVPPYVFSAQSNFLQCPACGRIYWRGTHWEAMRRRLEKFFTVDRKP